MLEKFLCQLLTLRMGKATERGSEGAVDYKGYTIRPAPRREGSRWLTAGLIEKEFPEGVKQRRFLRADSHNSKDDADAFSVAKAKQIIDEQGDKLFREDSR
ncbi:MAG TPA: HlyU family transcriptional regulator [Alphaproteobacteria bacterium]|nr:HlyU family transcriptional regulator [Alphaproteobacteria bacterium]